MFLRNVGVYLQDHTALHPRRPAVYWVRFSRVLDSVIASFTGPCTSTVFPLPVVKFSRCICGDAALTLICVPEIMDDAPNYRVCTHVLRRHEIDVQ
jgi:hypothetical protein